MSQFIQKRPKPMPKKTQRGFTLVEMLVATALVVVMMLMFAQVFQTASGLVSNQKGMAEQDQNVRTMTILLRGDMKSRTFMDVVPFVDDQDTSNAAVPGYNDAKEKGYDAEYRKGFFSISENDPDDGTDDVLHLTIRMDSPLNPRMRLPYSAKARLLRLPGFTGTDDQYLDVNPDQPEFDDGQTTVNGTGSSKFAEVCWFLRNGNLYRRMLLIRDPYDRGTSTGPPEEPTDGTGAELIGTFYDPDGDGVTDDHFWRDFDYSAYWEPDIDPTVPDPNDVAYGLKFHVSPESLQNTHGDLTVSNLYGMPRSLGNPLLRFGSSVNRRNSTTGEILGPREYIVEGGTAPVTKFIGRFTAQETADSDFKYPGSFTTPPDTTTLFTDLDPHAFNVPANPNSNPAGRTFSINPDNGLVEPFDNESFRRGEDLVMSNVHEFDIQVWDDGLATPGFVNLGHSNTTGYYREPDGGGDPTNDHSFGNRYDTWHPSEFMPSDPPYAPFNGTRLDPVTDPTRGLGSDNEIWLQAIRINIRFYDVASDSMRDLTFTFRLNRNNSTN